MNRNAVPPDAGGGTDLARGATPLWMDRRGSPRQRRVIVWSAVARHRFGWTGGWGPASGVTAAQSAGRPQADSDNISCHNVDHLFGGCRRDAGRCKGRRASPDGMGAWGAGFAPRFIQSGVFVRPSLRRRTPKLRPSGRVVRVWEHPANRTSQTAPRKPHPGKNARPQTQRGETT